MKKLTPIGDRAIIERINEEITSGSIQLTDKSKLTGNKGRIVAMGEGYGSVLDPGYKVDDIVYFNNAGALDMFIPETGDNITIINRQNILLKETEDLKTQK